MNYFLHTIYSKAWLAALCLLSVSVSAQQLASLPDSPAPISVRQTPTDDQQQTQPLKSVLQELEKQYQVYFNYDAKAIENIVVPSTHKANQDAPLEKLLSTYLEQHGLAYKKLDEGYYMIYQLPAPSGLSPLKRQPIRTTSPSSQSQISPSRVANRSLSKRQVYEKTITGQVTDLSTGETLPGVNILVKGTSIGTITDVEGNYRLTAPDDAETLVFSSVGYTSEEVAIGDRTTINLEMAPDIQSLSEIVVVGYGTQKKANLTGAVSTVSSEQIDARPITSAATALQGTATGVFVNQNSGQPGNDDVNISIRGIGTLNNADPLVLVDGIEAPLNNINPNDIENITVLKDAASASIYGSRGANGVVLVTTKRGGKAEGTVFNYNGYLGVTEALSLPEVVSDPVQYMQLFNTAAENFGNPPAYSDEQIESFRQSGQRSDWLNEIFSTAPIQQHNLSASGGSDKTNFRVSLGYLDQDGVVPKAGFQRFNGRLNLDTDINERFTIGTSVSIIRGTRTATESEVAEIGNNESLLATAIRTLPLTPIANEQGNLVTPAFGGRNVNEYIAENDYELIENDILASAYLEYEIFDGLQLRGTLAMNYQSDNDQSFVSSVDTYDQLTGDLIPPVAVDRQRNRSASQLINVTSWLQATYEKTFGDHQVKLLAGYNQETSKYDEFETFRNGFPSNSVRVLSVGNSANATNAEESTEWALQSYFGRLNYIFKDRYLFEANLRVDGSSRFVEDKWGSFPSFSAGWILSEENFFSVSFIDFAKIRASWGRLGNQNIGDFAYASELSLQEAYSFGGTVVPGSASTTLGNPMLTWEETTTADIGINLGLWDSRIQIEADYFTRETSGILYNVPVPRITGFENQIRNSAIVENQGWELGLAYNDNFGDLDFQIGGNVTYVKSNVVQVDETKSGEETDRFIDGNQIIERGQQINSYFGYLADGIFRSQAEFDAAPDHTKISPAYGPGDVRLVDTNGDGTINPEDRVVIGKQDPTWSYGFNLNLGYRGFDLGAIFQGAADFQSYAQAELAQPFYNQSALQTRWLDSWSPENTDASMPRLYPTNGPSNASINSFWLLDRTYFRLKNLQIGYTLPATIWENNFIKSVRVYANAQNLFTITDFPYFDPERPADADRGGDGFPNLRILSAGVNISF